MQFLRATPDQLDPVAALLQRTTATLNAQGILQWDERYPNRAFVEAAITDGNLYVLANEEVLLGSVVLDEWQSPEWEAIRWKAAASPVLVIHALAIDPNWQGQGYGSVFLGYCEAFARQNGYGSIRLDVFGGNPTARRLYERHGYEYCGQVQFAFKPAGHQGYSCYEKILIPGQGESREEK